GQRRSLVEKAVDELLGLRGTTTGADPPDIGPAVAVERVEVDAVRSHGDVGHEQVERQGLDDRSVRRDGEQPVADDVAGNEVPFRPPGYRGKAPDAERRAESGGRNRGLPGAGARDSGRPDRVALASPGSICRRQRNQAEESPEAEVSRPLHSHPFQMDRIRSSWRVSES